MIQKILYWENFLKMFQNGPIRKVIMKKVIFEDFLIFSPAVGNPGSSLSKISEDKPKYHDQADQNNDGGDSEYL